MATITDSITLLGGYFGIIEVMPERSKSRLRVEFAMGEAKSCTVLRPITGYYHGFGSTLCEIKRD